MIIDAHGNKYEQWTDGWAAGFKVTLANGATRFVYLNPSSEDSEGVAVVFLYEGPHGDPAKDGPIVHLVCEDN